MYIAPGQVQKTHRDKHLMSTESPYHFDNLLQISKKKKKKKIKELYSENSKGFKNFIRMDTNDFEEFEHFTPLTLLCRCYEWNMCTLAPVFLGKTLTSVTYKLIG